MECFFAKYTGDQLASTKWIMFYYVFFYDIENLGFYWILREHFHNFLIIKTLDEKRLKPLIYNELSLCCKLEFSNPDIFPTWWFKSFIFQTWQNLQFEISQIYEVGFQWYMDKKIKVWSKESIPLIWVWPKPLSFFINNPFKIYCTRFSCFLGHPVNMI